MADRKQKKARKPVQSRSIDKRKRLLETGEKLFSQKGFHGTNSKEIARLAEVSIGSFYAYFPDKESMFLEVLKGYYAEIFHHTQVKLEMELNIGSGLVQQIKSGINALYTAHTFKPELHREIEIILLQGGNKMDPDRNIRSIVRKKMDELDREVQSWIELILKQKLSLQDESSIHLAAALIFRVSEDTIHRLVQFPDSMESPEKVLEQLVVLVLAYIEKLKI